MKIIFIQLILPLATYFIGVLIGRRSAFKSFENYQEPVIEDIVDPEEIQHVGYTLDQMGFDK